MLFIADPYIILFITAPPAACCVLELLFAFWDKVTGKEYAVDEDILANNPDQNRDEGGEG